MKSYKNILWAALTLVIFSACRKNESLNFVQPNGLGGEVTTSTAIDKWILDSLTTPYNIAVKYRWDPWNASLYKTVTPPDESRVLPLFSALRKVWINPYNDETGSEAFMKRFAPKQFVLIGSVEYDFYSVTLGQAEGGNNIVFFDVNQNFDKNPVTSIKRVIHTAHHEFAHVLHQTVMYPLDFKGTSARLGLANYTATWFNVSDAEAFAQGYATAYSMSGPDDDFVEMVSTMLTEGKGRWDDMKAATNATARQAIQEKEDFVVTYFRQVWNIDFYRLQTRVQAALNALYPPSTVGDVYGLGKAYTRASVNPANTTALPQSAGFTTLFNSSKTALSAAVIASTTGRVLDSLAVQYISTSGVYLRMYFRTSAGVASQGIWQFTLTKDAGTQYTFSTVVGLDATANSISAAVAPLVNYFSGAKFNIDWYANLSQSVIPRVRFTPQATPANFLTARLLP